MIVDDNTIGDDCRDEEKHVYSNAQKPFGLYLREKVKKATPQNRHAAIVNPLHLPEWFEKKKWLPFTPFWTSMLRGNDSAEL